MLYVVLSAACCFAFSLSSSSSFFSTDAAPSDIYTLSLHDALPICSLEDFVYNLKTGGTVRLGFPGSRTQSLTVPDRKSTRLNSSHLGISYAIFCLKKKNKREITQNQSTRTNYTTSVHLLHNCRPPH